LGKWVFPAHPSACSKTPSKFHTIKPLFLLFRSPAEIMTLKRKFITIILPSQLIALSASAPITYPFSKGRMYRYMITRIATGCRLWYNATYSKRAHNTSVQNSMVFQLVSPALFRISVPRGLTVQISIVANVHRLNLRIFGYELRKCIL
jgi:hypothetical protein